MDVASVDGSLNASLWDNRPEGIEDILSVMAYLGLYDVPVDEFAKAIGWLIESLDFAICLDGHEIGGYCVYDSQATVRRKKSARPAP